MHRQSGTSQNKTMGYKISKQDADAFPRISKAQSGFGMKNTVSFTLVSPK